MQVLTPEGSKEPT